MGGYTLLPKFHLAFRRMLFYLLFLAVYLFVGSMIFFLLWRKGSPVKKLVGASEKLDFERAELLNVLYAEAIGRTETDWALLANQKLDGYERSLMDQADSGVFQNVKQRNLSFINAFRYSFFLITTIGPVDIDDLSYEIKFFSILYSVCGIPLMLLYLGQCAKAISSALPGLRNALILCIVVVFLIAMIHDIIEQGSDDTPFIDAVLTVYLTMATVGVEDDKDELPSILLCLTGLIALSAFSILFSTIQQAIEKAISPYELGFAVQYAHLERALSGNRLEVLEEDEEEEHSEWT